MLLRGAAASSARLPLPHVRISESLRHDVRTRNAEKAKKAAGE